MARLVEAGVRGPLRRVLDRDAVAPGRLPARHARPRGARGDGRARHPEPQNLTVHDFDVRTFPEHRQEILELLIEIWEDWRPDARLPAVAARRPPGPPDDRRRGPARVQADDDPRLRDPVEQLRLRLPGLLRARADAHRAQGRGAREVRVAAAPPLRERRVHLERRADARHQREPRVRRGVPGLPRDRRAAARAAVRRRAGAVDARTTSPSGGSAVYASGCAGTSSISSISDCAASRPFSSCGGVTVVSGGFALRRGGAVVELTTESSAKRRRQLGGRLEGRARDVADRKDRRRRVVLGSSSKSPRGRLRRRSADACGRAPGSSCRRGLPGSPRGARCSGRAGASLRVERRDEREHGRCARGRARGGTRRRRGRLRGRRSRRTAWLCRAAGRSVTTGSVARERGLDARVRSAGRSRRGSRRLRPRCTVRADSSRWRESGMSSSPCGVRAYASATPQEGRRGRVGELVREALGEDQPDGARAPGPEPAGGGVRARIAELLGRREHAPARTSSDTRSGRPNACDALPTETPARAATSRSRTRRSALPDMIAHLRAVVNRFR